MNSPVPELSVIRASNDYPDRLPLGSRHQVKYSPNSLEYGPIEDIYLEDIWVISEYL